ncbi:hypothetical protein MYX65_00210 [Acidobacteria bacterium AH-259-L09]|nr:hypothetical protein [Acidobacteria bacterium AH-259-L09]
MAKKIDPELELALLELVDERVQKIEVRRTDFLDLQATVRQLAEAQRATEQRLSAPAQAQARTELALQQLAQEVGRLERPHWLRPRGHRSCGGARISAAPSWH